MDKFEYKVKSEEIKVLIAEKDFAQAAEIADTIDWRRVKSVMMLCTISDLYKINRRYEDAKNMLLLAYDRRQGGRTICYSLCELCIKTGDYVQALKFYKEFTQVAPKDPGRYILQYKLYEAQDVQLEERIEVLEELKKRDYREKWAYELAYLYHRVGLATRCVEECDELILWFGEGKYVVKALELKMLHHPLTPSQQEIYDHRFDSAEVNALPPEEYSQEEYYEAPSAEEEGQESGQPENEESGHGMPEEEPVPERTKEFEIQVKTVDVGQYNTINLQEELAAGLQEVLGEDGPEGQEQEAAFGGREAQPDSEAAPKQYMDRTDQGSGSEGYAERSDSWAPEAYADAQEEIEGTEVFFGETGEIEGIRTEAEEAPGTVMEEAEVSEPEEAGTEEEERTPAEESPASEHNGETERAKADPEKADVQKIQEFAVQPPKELADVLLLEPNGQIRMLLPESAAVEKQITGQMKIEDILAEWERMKKENKEKYQEEIRKYVLRETGPMFTEFDAAIRDGLLEKLESGAPVEEGTAEAGAGQTKETAVMEEAAVMEGEQGTGEDGEAVEAGAPEEPFAPGYAGGNEDLEEAGDYVEPEYAEEGEGAEEAAGYIEPEYAEEGGEFEEAADYEEPGYAVEGQEPEEAADYEESEYTVEGQEPEEAGDYEEPEYAVEGQEPEDTMDYEDPEYIGEGEEPEEAGDYGEPEYAEEGQEPEEPVDYEDPEYIGEGEEPEEAGDYGEPEYAVDDEEAGEGVDYEEAEYDAQAESARKPAGSGKLEHTGKAPKGEEASYIEEPEEKNQVERDKAKVRGLTREEKELFAPFIQSRHFGEQLVKAIDSISMAAYTGNVIVTGEEGMDTLTLAKNIIREVSFMDRNFSGKVAKITGKGLNGRNIEKTLEQQKNGALIIQKASGMSRETAQGLHRALQQERVGIVVVLEDTKKAIQKLLLGTPELYGGFTARVDLEALSNDTLVAFGKRYAREKEYSIDDLGILALHTRIEENQTIDHVVTVIEVKQMVDDAIRHARRKTLGHFFDVLLARRYDDEDMIILTEKDFVA